MRNTRRRLWRRCRQRLQLQFLRRPSRLPALPDPVAPPAPEQGPPSPPEVPFREGQLPILARNSTLSDVLNSVKQKTGASVDMPASSSERVVGQFGPGAPRDVM